MSLHAMTDRALAADPAVPYTDPDAGDPAAAIVGYIPTEIVAVYVPAVAAITAPGVPTGDGQWVLLIVVLALTPITTWAVFAAKRRNAGAPLPIAPSTWPWPEMLIAAVAFLLWAFTLPRTPFEQYDWYRPGLAAVLLLVGTLVLGLLVPLMRPLPGLSAPAVTDPAAPWAPPAQPPPSAPAQPVPPPAPPPVGADPRPRA
jgi:hypothetical protein